MRLLLTVTLATALATSGMVAAAQTISPLAPGKPAGIKQAQGVSTTALVVIVGIAGTIAAVAFGTASSGNPGAPVPVTTVPTTTAA